MRVEAKSRWFLWVQHTMAFLFVCVSKAIRSQNEPNQLAVLSLAPASLQKNDPFCVPLARKCLTSGGGERFFCLYLLIHSGHKELCPGLGFSVWLAEVGHKPLMLMPLFSDSDKWSTYAACWQEEMSPESRRACLYALFFSMLSGWMTRRTADPLDAGGNSSFSLACS